MPATIDAQATSNDYSAACTITEVFKSNGGYFVISAADVFMEMQYGDKGLFNFTGEVHVPQGNGQLYPGTTGIRFRSFAAGVPATVSAALYYNAEPSFAITSSGLVTVTSGTITGKIQGSTGNVLAGSGFTCAHTGPGAYRITYTNPFAATPNNFVSVLLVAAYGDIPNEAPSTFAVQLQPANDADFSFISVPVT